MAKATIHTKLVEQLLANGHSEVAPTRRTGSTPKYITFNIPNDTTTPTQFLFVGKAGALRRGRCSTESTPVENTKARLIAQWDAAHTKK